jgi:hypothetical protein
MNPSPMALELWVRQAHRAFKSTHEKVYQISQIPKADRSRRPEVIATCSKSSAQRLLAGLAVQETAYVYGVTAVFSHPLFPGMLGVQR